MKTKLLCTLAISLSLLAIGISCFAFVRVSHMERNVSPSGDSELVQELIGRAKACIATSQEIKAKDEVLHLLDALEAQGLILQEGSDDLRVKFVHAQGSIEQVLSCALVLGEIKNLVGVIHTPMPATPLCTEVTNLDEQLLDSSIRYDLNKLLTIRSRAVILRDYLDKGGRLYITYPQGGLEKRSLSQQEIYKRELMRYANNLVDVVLNCSEMEPEKVGAMYFMKDIHGEIYAFSIKSRQANDPSDNSEWGLWMGAVKNSIIKQRVDEILDYLSLHDGPPLRLELNLL